MEDLDLDSVQVVKLPDPVKPTSKKVSSEQKKSATKLRKKAATNTDTESIEPINIDKILAPSTVELLTPEYMDIITKGKRLTSSSKEQAMNLINSFIGATDPSIGEVFRDTAIAVIANVHKVGSHVSLEQYIRATIYCTYIRSGSTSVTAYTHTFPDRVMRMQQEGQSMAYLHQYASSYASSKAVQEVQALTLIPTHLMYHQFFHKAIMTQVEIMDDEDVSPKVRSDAAACLITHLKPPEADKNTLSIKIDDGGVISQLEQLMNGIANKQRASIASGESDVIDVSHTVIYRENNDAENS